MKSVIVEEVGKVVVKDVPVPEISEDQVLIKMGIGCICSQTDTHIIEGKYPAATPFPVLLGHEAAGTVVAVGKRVKGYKPGDRVAYRGETGCLSEYSAQPLHLMFKIPDTVSLESAAMMEVSSCAYSLVRQCVKMGDRVLITGQGCAGLFGTIFARIAGATQIVVTEPSAYKREQSLRHGADIAINPLKEDLKARCEEITGGRGFDVVLEFSGTSEAMASSVHLIKEQGTIGMFGVCCDPVPFDFLAFHCKFGKIVSTGHEYAYNNIPYEKMLQFELSGMVNFAEFVTHKLPLTEIHKGLEMIRQQDETILRIGMLPTE